MATSSSVLRRFRKPGRRPPKIEIFTEMVRRFWVFARESGIRQVGVGWSRENLLSIGLSHEDGTVTERRFDLGSSVEPDFEWGFIKAE
jgi:hypothetical protein